MSSSPNDESTSRDDAFLADFYARAEEEIIPAHADYDPDEGLDRFLAQIDDSSEAGQTADRPAGPVASGTLGIPTQSVVRQGRYALPASLRLTRLAFTGVAALSGPSALLLLLLCAVHGWIVAPIVFAALGGGVLSFLLVMIRALFVRPVLITPAEYQAEQVREHPLRVGEFPPDLAWPSYTFRQAGIDRRVVRSQLGYLYHRIWRWISDAFLRSYHGSWLLWTFLLPVAVTVIVTLLAVTVSAWFCYGVYWLAMTACVTVSGAVLGLIRSSLRAAEAWRRNRRHTHATCTHCFHVTPWPAYECPGCSVIHHDVQPGRLGLFFRRCECGVRFPTTASRAAWHMTAVCRRSGCKRPLSNGAGAIRDIRIPVFGDISAGKTRFLYASLNSLLLSAEQARIPVSFADQLSQEQAAHGLTLIRSGQETAKTPAIIPVALTLRLREGRRSELIHLLDAAGEHFRSAQQYGSLRFLGDSQGLVYVLDPFSIGVVRDRLAGHNSDVMGRAHPAAGDPEIAYSEVTSRLRDMGVPAASQRLAVVISKADLLRRADVALPSESNAIATWLADVGLHNLVMAASREFAEVRYFTVASQDATFGGPDDPGVPLRWLLKAHGVRLPADPMAHRGFRATPPDQARSKTGN